MSELTIVRNVVGTQSAGRGEQSNALIISAALYILKRLSE